MFVHIDEIENLVKEHPYSTTQDLMKLFYTDIESKSHYDRVVARNKINKRLWKLYRQGHIEPVPDSKPTMWKALGIGEIARKRECKVEKGKSLKARCKECGMAESTVRGRIKRGWSVEDALTIPAKR